MSIITDLPEGAILNDIDRANLKDAWNLFGSYITGHQGTPDEDKFMKSKINIKDNPLLVKAIEDIRDKYFELAKPFWYFEKQRSVFSVAFGTKRDRALVDQIRSIQDAMISHNANSLQRLQEPGYGFTLEQRAQILKEVPEPAPLSDKEAFTLLSHIIKQSIYCFENMMGKPLIVVPSSFASHDSDSMGANSR